MHPGAPPPGLHEEVDAAAVLPAMRKKLAWLMPLVRVVLAVVIAAGGAWLAPTPYTLRAPGHADDLAGIVHVQGGKSHPPGHLYMTTVIYEKASVLYCLYALLDPSAELLPQDHSVLRLRGLEEYHPTAPTLAGLSPMDESKRSATLVALRHLGYKVDIVGAGVRVSAFFHGSPASRRLKEGDAIEWALGRRVRSVAELRNLIQDLPAGRLIRLKVRRENRTIEVPVTLIRPRDRTLVGFVAEDIFEPIRFPVQVDIETHNINGASAGLMFALAIIDQLTPGGITQGQRVAGTGTIDLDGKVGPIEGIELKQVAARRAGAEVFLVPRENMRELPAMEGMRQVPVGTLAEAVKALGGR